MLLIAFVWLNFNPIKKLIYVIIQGNVFYMK